MKLKKVKKAGQEAPKKSKSGKSMVLIGRQAVQIRKHDYGWQDVTPSLSPLPSCPREPALLSFKRRRNITYLPTIHPGWKNHSWLIRDTLFTHWKFGFVFVPLCFLFLVLLVILLCIIVLCGDPLSQIPATSILSTAPPPLPHRPQPLKCVSNK